MTLSEREPLKFAEISSLNMGKEFINNETDERSSDDSPFVNETPTFSKEKAQILPIASCLRRSVIADSEILESDDHVKKTVMKPTSTGKKRIRQKNFCIYCESLVTNFSRHVFRNHKLEIEVQQILSKAKASNERKKLLTLLRNKGNFLENTNRCSKPMKMPPGPIEPDKYLPCSSCLGFYSRKQLWRHRKKCIQIESSRGKNHQAAGQNLLLRNFQYDLNLKENVFPRMRADEISLVAKSDRLICAYGARYLRIHRGSQFVNVTSRKMRELAKLLLKLRTLNTSITDLFSALQPRHYDYIVEATKHIAQYDVQKSVYKSPTYAMNISTALKNCCDIGINFALKKKSIIPNLHSEEAEANLKTLIHLIETNWRYDVSCHAADDLNVKTWNKVSLVPLASDLKKLKTYLITMGNSAAATLREHPDNERAFMELVETVYCRVILLNRRRPGELERLPLHVYESCGNQTREGYEEILESISPTEKILLDRFKRIVIKGKRNRGVPVLFSADIQDHIQIMIDVRYNFIPNDNIYLFAKPRSSIPLCGYKVVQKYANRCHAKNPQAITCTRLRKHLATLTQILNMNSSDMEQLAKFMGHSMQIHFGSYRLPDDVFQTAKLSKLLVLMERGEAGEYKGKSLDEIVLDLNEHIEDQSEEVEDEAIEHYQHEALRIQPAVNSGKIQAPPTQPAAKSGVKRILTPWTDEQKTIVKTFFQNHIANKTAPKRSECEKLIASNSEVMHNKDWLKIKVFVQNTYKKT